MRVPLEEIKILGLKNHTLTVVITGSDTYEEDEDEAGNLIKIIKMMSDEDRNQQKRYVQQALDNIATEITCQHPKIESMLKGAKVFSVSAWYAERGGELNLWDASGMTEFVNSVVETAKGRGVKMKTARPLENLRAFLMAVQSSDLKRIETFIKKTEDKLSHAKKEMARNAESLLRDMRTDLTRTIERLANEYTMDNLAFKARVKKEYKIVWLKYTEKLIEQYAESLGNATVLDIDDTDLEFPEFAKHIKTIRRQREINKKRGGALGTLLASAAAIATGGASLLVTIPTTLAAAYVGNKLGEKAGGYFDSDEFIEIDLGDNREEVSIETRKRLVNQANERLQTLIKLLDRICYQSTESWVAGISDKVKELRQETEQMVQINSELAKLK